MSGYFSAYMYVHHVCPMPSEASKSPLGLDLQATVWVLGTKPKSFARAAGAEWLSHCSSPTDHSFYAQIHENTTEDMR